MSRFCHYGQRKFEAAKPRSPDSKKFEKHNLKDCFLYHCYECPQDKSDGKYMIRLNLLDYCWECLQDHLVEVHGFTLLDKKAVKDP